MLATTVSQGVPLLWVALGELVSERAGVLNIGIEGMMLMGAMGGVLGALYSNNLFLGLLTAIIASLFIVLIHGVLSIRYRADQVVSGIMLNILALGLSTFISELFLAARGGEVEIGLQKVAIPLLSRIPVLGQILFHQNILTYLGLLMVLVIHFLLFRTRSGLLIRAAGEDPHTAYSLGFSIQSIRWKALLFTGIMSGIGGAHLSMGELGFFTENMTAGRGFIALAAVIFGRWKPLGCLFAVMLFGFAEALQIRIQALGILNVPPQFLAMLPYVVTIGTLALYAHHMRPPAALGKAFVEE
jgi:simple sugar transport system permease protein